MRPIPALSSFDGCAVDARPFVVHGLLDIKAVTAGVHPANGPVTDRLFEQLADDDCYATLMRPLVAAVDDAANATAQDLDCDVNPIRRGYSSALGLWQVALWRLDGHACHLVMADPATVVMCPVAARTHRVRLEHEGI